MKRPDTVVLLAEPDCLTCGAIAEMLKACGHVVIPVTTLAPAVHVLDAVMFDALLVPIDEHHTHVDLNFVKAAKARQPGVKVVAMSTQSYSPTPETEKLIDGFLHKPFDLLELDEMLGAILGGVGMRAVAGMR